MSLYASLTNPEPSAESNDWSYWNERKVIISETLPKPPKTTKKDRFRKSTENEPKNFRSKCLYLCFVAEVNMTVRVSIAYPNSTKPINELKVT